MHTHHSTISKGSAAQATTHPRYWWPVAIGDLPTSRTIRDNIRPMGMQKSLRRVSRYVFTMLCCLSLLLAIATAILWLRGRHRFDALAYRRYAINPTLFCETDYLLDLGNGSLWFMINWHHTTDQLFISAMRDAPPPSGFSVDESGNFAVGFPPPPGSHLGFFAAIDPESPGTVGALRIHLPYTGILCLSMILPIICLATGILHYRRRQPVVGRCAKCGYDLRATPDRCPECGTAARLDE